MTHAIINRAQHKTKICGMNLENLMGCDLKFDKKIHNLL
jgi:hypothetical protein